MTPQSNPTFPVTTTAFLPPGVQRRLCELLHLRAAPQEYPMATSSRISALWARRNNCPEDQIERIDYDMETEAIAGWVAIQIDAVKTQVGKRRAISALEAEAIIRRIAPAGTPSGSAAEVAQSLASSPDDITIWSPDGGGGLRYDQPGTMSHTPPLLLTPQNLTLPTHAPYWNRALVLRVNEADLSQIRINSVKRAGEWIA